MASGARVTDAAIDSFQANGAVCIRGAFDADLIERLRADTDETIRHPSSMHRIAKTPGESGQFFKDYHMARRLPAFEDFVRRPAGGEIAARL
ncbi:MAG: hypothetical protein FJX51_04255 [Alphaproteobacteria bacterium]|nr:hypothetical protein [Alphaproteobacteria bacterium]